jgi:hypothetical protein
MAATQTYIGSCHCGAVRYEVDLDLSEGASRCNCSMCQKTSMANIVVKPSAFRLLSGADNVTDYIRAGGVNHFPFCKTCGVRAFATGRLEELGGDYVSINVNCLEDVELADVKHKHWDGRHNNWDAGTRSEPWPIRR